MNMCVACGYVIVCSARAALQLYTQAASHSISFIFGSLIISFRAAQVNAV